MKSHLFERMASSKSCWSTLAVLLLLGLISNTGTEARPSKSEKSRNSFLDNYEYDSDIDDNSASSVSSESVEEPKSKTKSENTLEAEDDLNSDNLQNSQEDEDADLSTITIQIKLPKSKSTHHSKTHHHQKQSHSVNSPNHSKNHKSNSSKENLIEDEEEEKYLQAVREYFSKFHSSDKSILSAPVSGQDLQCRAGQEWSDVFGQCIRSQSSTTRRTARGRRKQRHAH